MRSPPAPPAPCGPPRLERDADARRPRRAQVHPAARRHLPALLRPAADPVAGLQPLVRCRRRRGRRGRAPRRRRRPIPHPRSSATDRLSPAGRWSQLVRLGPRQDRDEAGHRQDGAHPGTCPASATRSTKRRRRDTAACPSTNSARWRPPCSKSTNLVRTALDLGRVVCGRRGNPTSRLRTYPTETLHRRAGRRRTPDRSPASAERGFRTPRAPRSSPSRTHRAVPSGADRRSGAESNTSTRRQAHLPERRRAVRLKRQHLRHRG